MVSWDEVNRQILSAPLVLRRAELENNAAMVGAVLGAVQKIDKGEKQMRQTGCVSGVVRNYCNRVAGFDFFVLCRFGVIADF